MDQPGTTNFDSRLIGALTGGAIGDGMGAPMEGRGSDEALARLKDWDFTRFIPPRDWDGVRAYRKGNGRITDDTLMTEALIDAYIEAGDHLDAFGYARYLLPRIVNKPVWVPEVQQEMPIFERLWMPEKYPRWRLELSGADPRSAGVGNMCNCGVAMWIMPVGAVNAGDARAAYQEAAAIALAHNESFAVEAAAVLAGAYAAALTGASIEAVIAAALQLAQDGTGRACAQAVQAVDQASTLPQFITAVRRAVTPFDQRSEHTSDDQPLAHDPTRPSEIGRPSRTKSIEELPVALAALKYGGGDFLRTLGAAVCYGRDCDSIASMACGLWGAMHGVEMLPPPLVAESAQANRRDFHACAIRFASSIRKIADTDLKRQQIRHAHIFGGDER